MNSVDGVPNCSSGHTDNQHPCQEKRVFNVFTGGDSAKESFC